MTKRKQGKRVAKTQSFRAKLFKNGGSQAVRLPKECQLSGTEVSVRKEGRSIVLTPISRGWSRELIERLLDPSDAKFPDREQPRHHEREHLFP